MVLKRKKPVTPSQRFLKTVDLSHLKKGNIKNLKKGLKKTGGRNNLGRITSFQRGGGHKRSYRFIDFERNRPTPGFVKHLEYDPNRSAHIACVFDFEYKDHYYIIAPKNLKKGAFIANGHYANLEIGHSLSLTQIPVGAKIHNISLKPNEKAIFVRSAGTYGQIIRKTNKFAQIRLPSGEQRFISLKNKATIGVVSNGQYYNQVLGKAGRKRWLGKRPNVRGVAMNPIDHPHGGGEGKSSGGRPSVTPWGKPTKGQPTVRTVKKYLVKKRKKIN